MSAAFDLDRVEIGVMRTESKPAKPQENISGIGYLKPGIPLPL